MQVLMKGSKRRGFCSLFGGGEGGVERWGWPLACSLRLWFTHTHSVRRWGQNMEVSLLPDFIFLTLFTWREVLRKIVFTLQTCWQRKKVSEITTILMSDLYAHGRFYMSTPIQFWASLGWQTITTSLYRIYFVLRSVFIKNNIGNFIRVDTNAGVFVLSLHATVFPLNSVYEFTWNFCQLMEKITLKWSQKYCFSVLL